MMKSTFLSCLLVVAFWQLQGQVIEILPAKPERGKPVTVTYHTNVAGAKISADAKNVNIVFTYSTFYELPWKMPMAKSGKNWMVTFTPQRYATFASFYIQSGDVIEKPALNKHYELKVYDGDKRVLNSQLHESYSLSAQMPKAKELQSLKLKLEEKELKDYPNNYQAKVAHLVTKMAMAETKEEKFKYRTEARNIIAAKFEEDPTFTGNVNLVTMGYLMIGEKNRLDSIRKVIMNRYPEADISIDLKAEIIAKEKDSPIKVAKLKALVAKKVSKTGDEGSSSVNSLLFDHYVKVNDSTQALFYASKLVNKSSPYLPVTLKDISSKLTAQNIAPTAALSYAQHSLKLINSWPVGIIRYFPEFGYIPSFVADSARTNAIAGAKTDLYALMALNYFYKGKKIEALNYVKQAESFSNSRTGLLNVASVYQQTNENRKAFDVLWKLLLNDPTDSTVLNVARINFLKYNPSQTEFDTKVKHLESLEMLQLKVDLKKKLLNQKGPELSGLIDLNGKTVTPEMMKSKIVILDFWATWCVPCMQEMPYFQKVYDKYKNNPKIMFMVVNSGSNNTLIDAQKWVEKNKHYTFPVYYNQDKNLGEKVGFTLIPTIAVIDKNGLMQFKTIGFEGAILQKKLSAEIEILLETQ